VYGFIVNFSLNSQDNLNSHVPVITTVVLYKHFMYKGLSWPWSYGSWIYNYLCNQCLSPLTLRVQISLWRGVLETTLCDQVCQWLEAGWWFSPVSSTNKTNRHDITGMLLKVALKNPNPNLTLCSQFMDSESILL